MKKPSSNAIPRKKESTSASTIYANHMRAMNAMAPEYQEIFVRFKEHLDAHEENETRKQLYIIAVIEKIAKASQKQVKAEKVLDANPAKEMRNLNREQDIKGLYKLIVKRDSDKCMMVGVAYVILAYLSIMFFRSWAVKQYITGYSFDAMIAIGSFFVMLVTLDTRIRLFKKYHISMKYIYADVVTYLACLAIKFMVTLPFDVTFILLLAEHLIGTRFVQVTFKKLQES